MSTAINSYSLSATSSTSTSSAGSESRKKISFDDLLLLPSLPSSKSTSNNYLCYSAKVSPLLPSISNDSDIQRKYNTAPASPHHHNFYTNTITPKTSPLFNNAQLITPALKFDTNNSNDHLQYQPRRLNSLQESLPSLRHLQLLPDPRIQEYAGYYPDTSVCTPLWKRNIVHWCKETNYQDYTKIEHEISHDRTQLSALLRGSNAFRTNPKIIPSVLRPKDAFQDLSDFSERTSAPMTPPMSPNQASHDAGNPPPTPKFTPFVSGKLVQTVRQESLNSSGSSNGHKKTNSFKALQLKNLLNNRDILSCNSKPNNDTFKVTKPRNSLSSSSSSLSSSSSTRARLNINNAAKQFVIRLDNDTNRSSNSSPTRADDTTPQIFSNTADARSRSISPIRPATPPHTAPSSSSKYHKFSLDSPQSPVITSIKQSSYNSNGVKTISLRRRSSGSNTHTTVRKCVSCHSSDSPCWRPSWSGKKQDQLCNSCGLRYKKTHTRCLKESCRKIPTKGELSIMKANGIVIEQNQDGTVLQGYRCLFCNCITETTELQRKTINHN